ncbi:hypothetical protein [Piscinibacter sp. XHJ-5]|uniref:hypothetical protein n=1 Tax=Piscinibacter sp. XHJ-5 TaxID=3037797 RepID=UPI002452A375|nr:hypothetical protein [Piscinibacter sp. XHJ-5]
MQDTPTLSQAQIDSVLKAAQLDPATVERTQRAYRRYIELQAGRPAGWHGPTDIVTLAGLGGEFFWSEEWIRPAKMSFTFDAGKEGSQGTYRVTTALTDEQGVFHCVPNNPAIGWAFISLMKNGGPPRHFTVAGMMTDSAWRISVLMLNKIGPDGPVHPPFSALRIL